VTIEVGAEGAHHRVSDIVDMHERTELYILRSHAPEPLIIKDQNRAKDDRRDLCARGPCRAHFLGEPLGHAIRTGGAQGMEIVYRSGIG